MKSFQFVTEGKSFFRGVFFVFFFAFVFPALVHAQVCDGGLCWSIGSSRPNYLLTFVAADNTYTQYDASASLRFTTNFGTDAFLAEKVQSRSELWALHPLRDRPVKLFPLALHRASGIIDASESYGAVLEPNSSLDGNWVLFSYIHDARRGVAFTNQYGQARSGADLYRINLSALKVNPNVDPATLPIERLTFPPASVNQDAFNIGLASNAQWAYYKPFNIHAIEIMTDLGVRVIYASDKAHVQNSNHGTNTANFNLYMARYGTQGALEGDSQFLRYTTTSAISPANTRNGFAFSYQASTEDSRYWAIQHSDSAGTWSPLQGFGRFGFASFHLGTLCQTSSSEGDFWFSNVYYPNKNNGFGGLLGIPMSLAGKNHTFTPPNPGSLRVPTQAGEFLLTTSVQWDQDLPALMSGGAYIGKVTTPRCGPPDVMFLSWSPTFANNVYSGTAGVDPPPYDAQIVVRNELLSPAPPNDPSVYRPVINETTRAKSLLWPTPMNSFQERFGQDPVVATRISNISGRPEAIVGSSSMRTDVAPRECRLANGKFDPHKVLGDTQRNATINNVAGLSWVRDNNPANLESVCQNPVLPENVFGVSIQITDHKTDTTILNPVPFRKESVRRLGVVKTRDQFNGGQRENSFKSLIPANVPFEMHLLHARYGLRMADVRSWHSLMAGEVRHDCGGCHRHTLEDPPAPWEGTLASQSSYPTLDLLATTPVIEYDATCQPNIVLKSSATEGIPVWGDGRPFYNKFVQNCSGCHAPGQSGAPAFVVGSTAQQTFQNLTTASKLYLNEDEGALGSPAFWAARGERTDNRNNADPYYTKPFTYSSVHNSLNLCGSLDNWVYEFGLWIDNHMPVDWLYIANSAEMDRFLPTAHLTLAERPGCGLSGGVKVGVWDDRGSVSLIRVSVNGDPQVQQGTTQNGVVLFSSLGLSNSSDKVALEVIDGNGNRFLKEWSGEELVYECQTGADPRNGVVLAPPPTPTATPSSTPTATPTPGGESLAGGGAELRLSPSRAREGTLVKVLIEAPSFAGADALLLGSHDYEGEVFFEGANGRLLIPLGFDSYFGATRAARKIRLDAQGRGVGWISIPDQLSYETLTVSYVAVLFSHNSNTILGSSDEKSLLIKARHRAVTSSVLGRRLDKVVRTLDRLGAERTRTEERRSLFPPSSRRYQNLTRKLDRIVLRAEAALIERELLLEAESLEPHLAALQ